MSRWYRPESWQCGEPALLAGMHIGNALKWAQLRCSCAAEQTSLRKSNLMTTSLRGFCLCPKSVNSPDDVRYLADYIVILNPVLKFTICSWTAGSAATQGKPTCQAFAMCYVACIPAAA